MTMPSKAPTHTPYYPIGRVPMSPPEISESSTTTGSRTSGSISGDYDSSNGMSGVDVLDMLERRVNNAFDPTPLDRGLVVQAQTSGNLNAKQRELLELQALAQRRLKGVRNSLNEGIKVAKETKHDLEWTQKRVSTLKSKAERVHPDEYRRATQKYAYDYDY